MQLIAGSALLILGIGALIFPIMNLSAIAYPILWWGIIFLLDFYNFRYWKTSLMREDAKKFWLIIVPLSAIFWLYYEFVNLVYPQWGYIGIITGTAGRVGLSLLSFGTVIPIIVELLWIFKGPFQGIPVSAALYAEISRYKLFFVIAGIVAATLPFYSGYFYANQLMWVGPLIILLPFTAFVSERSNRFWIYTTIAGAVSGVLWEFLNFWAGGKWQYAILPDALHIFEMPILGYIGFIPFAFSTVALYLLAKNFIEAKLVSGLLLYAVAIGLSYLFVIAI
jgi:hypothetical protein